MKKSVIIGTFLFLLVVIGSLFFLDLNKNENSLKKIRVAEVARTIFYAPQYVAINQGFFEEEGLEIELLLTPGADKVTASVLSGDVDIGFSGSEATIYVYNGGEKDYLQTFAQLTKRDGSFLVSREKIEHFTLDDLKGKTVIGGRKGGMPEMTFEWALRQNGIDPINDLTIDTSVAFAAMSGAFIGGQGDFVTLFEPNALQIEQEGYGYVVASIGELGGIVPYTSYYAKKSYINENSTTIKKFNQAIQKGLDYVHNHTDEEIANCILSFFPDTKKEDLINVIKRYKEVDSWPTSTQFSKESFDHLQEIMSASGELSQKVPFEDLIYLQD